LRCGTPTRIGNVKPAESGSSGKAIASLVLGILGILSVNFIFAIIAVALGNSAKKNREASGMGMATAGVILGWITLVIFLLVVIVVIIGTCYANNSGGYGFP